MSYEYTDPDGDTISVEITERDDGQLVVALVAESHGDPACVHIPLDHVEELIAGIRDTARQAAKEEQQ